MLTLYYSPGACSLAAHIALLENNLQYSLKKVDLGTHKTEDKIDLMSINPKGYVPVLQIDNKQTLTEGAAILFYITEQGISTNTALKSDPFARYRLQEWLTFVSSELHKTLGAFFDKQLPAEYKVRLREKLQKRFNFLETTLGTAPYLCGDQFSAADAYCYTILNWMNMLETGLSLSDWPKVSAYVGRIANRPKVKQALTEEGMLK